MKAAFDADDLNLISLAKDYSTERKARKLFESLRWADGKPVCPHCGHDEYYTLKSKPDSKHKLRDGVYMCAACRKKYTATVGTVFEDSHVKLSKWMMAIFILCSSKKSVSALQLSRMLKTTYKTAWFMAHRIRHAMMDKPGETEKLTGTVEVDEVFIGGVGDRKTKFSRLTPVVALVQRDGKMHTRVVASVSQNNLGKVLHECVDKSAILNTDEHDGYKPAGKEFAKHESVNHSKEEYHRVNPDGTVTTTNSAESFFALFRRGVHGAWHCVSREHLPKYANEFAFRWSTRKESDGQRMASFMPMIDGKRLLYRQPAN
ncbi:MAG TPA: IS1595 family transposase [Burkholderiaceae bacterium]|nr:IS1595 family transposase [Burkholderiaceae bacterium]